MKNTLHCKLKLFFLFTNLLFIHIISLGQSPPNLGAASSFALFTAVGAFTNVGDTTNVTGDVGTNVGAYTAFPPGILVGSFHVADPTSVQAAMAVDSAYSYLFGLTCDSVIGSTLGSGQVLSPMVYCIGEASTLNGTLTLDGQGDPNALFVFKIDGALSTATFSNVNLINSASLCNVYWQINGAFALGDSSVFRGTILANGQIELLEGSSLLGQGLSKEGAILLHNNLVALGMQPIAMITANGATNLCLGDSVTLTASVSNGVGPFSYLWSPGGQTDSSITVSPSVTTKYFVAVTAINGCSYGIDSLVITLHPAPTANAGSDDTLTCIDTSIILSGSSATEGALFSWAASGGGHIVSDALTATPTVDAAGTYILTVTNPTNGCTAKDTAIVTLNNTSPNVNAGADAVLTCIITSIALSGSSSTAGATFNWVASSGGNIVSGATTATPTVNAAGVYTLTVTNPANGCTATDAANVTMNQVDLGPDTTVCSCIILNAGNPGATYTWCSGQDYQTINVCQTGTYCVTVSNGTCIDSDTIHITVNPPPVVDLGNDTTLVSGTLVLNAGNPGASYWWSTGDTTQTITVALSGQYYVTVTDVYGCTASDTINVYIPVGINENAVVGLKVNVYPSPSSDKTFTLSFNTTERTAVEIKIMNILGKVVYSERLENFSGAYHKIITLKNMANGIYFTDVLNGTRRSTTKIILE